MGMTLGKWFTTGALFLSWEKHLAMPRDIFAHHSGDAPGIQWGEARDAAKLPTEPGQPPSKELSAHNLSSAKAEGPAPEL